ncbi:coiled-coil domain-containing protein 93-like isoform X1 [Carassius gibelio]|uniref:coiled-coil domain-containing protein 93-like isoform X1 n=1 Tax=Carassius gibelio TaxID=101364 RepID=UPI0022776E6E|nr:coiled-coil domain-containing protein 93-like isoform X1 [Carassius gibelio]
MTQVSEEEDLQAAEELRIKALLTGMAAMATEEGKLSASTVGQIVGLQSEEIKQIDTEYAEKSAQWRIGQRDLDLFSNTGDNWRHSTNKSLRKQKNWKSCTQHEARATCEDAKTTKKN